ncbi:MAG: matrixin family metalloprotease [Proteobacteria bacterium]|nr:matrixin family metalloprotease [Pseudomonadota bacterium]
MIRFIWLYLLLLISIQSCRTVERDGIKTISVPHQLDGSGTFIDLDRPFCKKLPIKYALPRKFSKDLQRQIKFALLTWELATGKKLFEEVTLEGKLTDPRKPELGLENEILEFRFPDEMRCPTEPDSGACAITDVNVKGPEGGRRSLHNREAFLKKQQEMSEEDFQKFVDKYTKWLNSNEGGINPLTGVDLGDSVGGAILSDIYYNTLDFEWIDAGHRTGVVGKNPNDIQSITLHEVGHVLGLGHSHDDASIMYPAQQIQVDTRGRFRYYIGAPLRKLSKSDVQSIQKVCGCSGEACDQEAIYRKIPKISYDKMLELVDNHLGRVEQEVDTQSGPNEPAASKTENTQPTEDSRDTIPVDGEDDTPAVTSEDEEFF